MTEARVDYAKDAATGKLLARMGFSVQELDGLLSQEQICKIRGENASSVP